MQMVLTALIFIGCPMAVTQLAYRLVDRKGKRTAKLVEKFPILKQKKFVIQIIIPILFILFLGVIAIICSIPIKVFFIICGAFVGIINGMAVTIMYNE